ncbi:glycosyltransferase [Thermoflexus sp.]|uniref:glycosyltransferase n=1 Tax=Thermoflexus sp. TaxID=1969742 RepID=UPI0035E42D4E
MRLLYVANGFPPAALGGVEIHTWEIARAMARRGHAVWVFCRESDFQRPDYELIREEVDGLSILRVVNDFKQTHHFLHTYVDERMEEIFLQVLQETRPDLIHFQHLIGLSARLPCRARPLRIPMLMTLHDFWPLCHRVHLLNRWGQPCPGPFQGGDCVACVRGPRPTSRLHSLLRAIKPWLPAPLVSRIMRRIGGAALSSWAEADQRGFQARHALFREALMCCALLMAPSDFVREVFRRNNITQPEIRVLPLGILPPDSEVVPEPGERNTLRIGYIGWFRPPKGVHLLIQAFRRIPDEGVSLHLFGPIDESYPYFRRLRGLGGEDPRIVFRGPFALEDRSQIYRSIDLLVIPSISPETFSRVAREALIHRVPVVASRIGALPEVVRDGVNGFLFEPGDVEGLSQILQRIVRCPSILKELDVPGPAQILSVEDHVQALEQMYREVLSVGD